MPIYKKNYEIQTPDLVAEKEKFITCLQWMNDTLNAAKNPDPVTTGRKWEGVTLTIDILKTDGATSKVSLGPSTIDNNQDSRFDVLITTNTQAIENTPNLTTRADIFNEFQNYPFEFSDASFLGSDMNPSWTITIAVDWRAPNEYTIIEAINELKNEITLLKTPSTISIPKDRNSPSSIAKWLKSIGADKLICTNAANPNSIPTNTILSLSSNAWPRGGNLGGIIFTTSMLPSRGSNPAFLEEYYVLSIGEDNETIEVEHYAYLVENEQPFQMRSSAMTEWTAQNVIEYFKVMLPYTPFE